MSEKLISSRQTVFLRREQIKSERFEFYPWMFIEDVSLLVMPIRAKDSGITASMAAGPEWSQFVAAGLSQGHGVREDLADAVCELLRSTVHELLSSGACHYEIVTERNDAGELKAWHLAYVDGRSLVTLGNWVFQVLSAEDAERLRRPRVSRVRKQAIVRFTAPPAGRGRTQTDCVRRMAELPMAGDMIPYEGDTAGFLEVYDISLQARTEAAALASITRSNGWNGRSTLTEYVSYWYEAARRIRFEEFLIALRERLLETLNDALRRLGHEVGADLSIRIDGLTDLELTAACHRDLEMGTATIDDILKRLMH